MINDTIYLPPPYLACTCPPPGYYLAASVPPSAPHLGYSLLPCTAAQTRQAISAIRHYKPMVKCLDEMQAPVQEKNFTFHKYSEMTGYRDLSTIQHINHSTNFPGVRASAEVDTFKKYTEKSGWQLNIINILL